MDSAIFFCEKEHLNLELLVQQERILPQLKQVTGNRQNQVVQSANALPEDQFNQEATVEKQQTSSVFKDLSPA